MRRIERGLAKAGPFLLLASLLPGLSAIDHWGPGAHAEEPQARTAPQAPSLEPLAMIAPGWYWHTNHWMPPSRRSSRVGSTQLPGGAEEETHISHCHFNPASCSDQPLTPNANAFPGLIELPSPALNHSPLYDSVPLYEEFLASPPDQPPQSV